MWPADYCGSTQLRSIERKGLYIIFVYERLEDQKREGETLRLNESSKLFCRNTHPLHLSVCASFASHIGEIYLGSIMLHRVYQGSIAATGLVSNRPRCSSFTAFLVAARLSL